MTKKQLAIELSTLRVFEDPDRELEQYPTDSDVAADALWTAMMLGWIENKTIADLGAGTGTLGIGCLLLRASNVTFIEKDPKAIVLLKRNIGQYETNNFKILRMPVSETTGKYDLVVQNPPFGTSNFGADTEFLKAASRLSNRIITFHKSTTDDYIKKTLEELGFEIKSRHKYKFPLKQTMPDHKKRIHRIDVTGWLAEKHS